MEYNSPRVGIGGKIRKSRSRLSIGRFYPASWTDPDLSITRITLSLSPHLSRSHSFATEGTRAMFPSLASYLYVYFFSFPFFNERSTRIEYKNFKVYSLKIYEYIHVYT